MNISWCFYIYLKLQFEIFTIVCLSRSIYAYSAFKKLYNYK